MEYKKMLMEKEKMVIEKSRSVLCDNENRERSNATISFGVAGRFCDDATIVYAGEGDEVINK